MGGGDGKSAGGAGCVARSALVDFTKKHPELHIQSIACVPVRSGNKTLGVIQLLNSKLDLMSEYSISFLRILCDYAAIAINNARSMTLIQELTITDDCHGIVQCAASLHDAG